MTDYEIEYQAARDVCGSQFTEVYDFFASRGDGPFSVLDLGCGQGRDAIPIAQMGHDVLGVDLSATGVAQMLEEAQAQDLNITGVVSSIERFSPTQMYDVILIDRVLHILNEPLRRSELKRFMSFVVPNGYFLVIDTMSNQALIEACFDPSQWHICFRKGYFQFWQKLPDDHAH